jgi:glutathione synthase/RimK-type ligase-like ATP-grasp enzyme
MTKRIAILTPDPSDRDFHSRWRDVLERTAVPLRNAGVEVEGRSWAEADDLKRFDLVMPLLVWGYHRAGPDWQAATKAWEAAGVRLQNPPSVLRWNSDKLYLGRLAEQGAPVVPTLYVERLTEEGLHTAAEAFATDYLIAKPQVSASAWQTIRWSPGGSLDGGPTGAAMIQPFLPSIEYEGELSLIYLGSAFSHAIRKRPQPGDFRVQPEHDGIITPHAAARDEMAAAEAILAAVEEELLYARVDLIRGLDGSPALMEVELVEPDLYLQHDPSGGAAFVDAVTRAAAA